MSRIDDEKNGGTIALAVIGGIAVIPALVVWQGYVLSILWAWFIVPLGAPGIGIAHAIGLAILAGVSRSTCKDDRKFAELLVAGFCTSAFALLLGWIVHLFM